MLHMRYKIGFGFIFVGIIALFAVIFTPERNKMLSDYRQLTSDVEIRERLEYVPSIKRLSSICPIDEVFVGYATFVFPFGEIDDIDSEYPMITLNSNTVMMRLSNLSYSETFIENSDAIALNYALTFEGGKVKLKESDAFDKYDALLMEIQRAAPFEFYKRVFTATPKNFISLLLMPFENLYLYVKMLEIKNQSLIGYDVTLFETDHINGTIDRSKADANHVLIQINERNQRFAQAVLIQSNDIISDRDVDDFLSSFRYHVETVHSRHSELPEVIAEALSGSDPTTGGLYKDDK